MIHWFTRRGRNGALLLAAPIAVLAIVLLNATGSTQTAEQDSDADGIADAYELFFGLDINTNDAGLDYDGDNLSNLQESFLLTDPFCYDTDRDGFNDLVDSNAVSRAYIPWGDPQFTAGDMVEYAHPDWLLGAYKSGGEWVVDTATTQSAWRVSADEDAGAGSLNVDLSRTILTNNLVYAIHYADNNKSSLYLDLLDTNGMAVVADLFGNLTSGTNADVVILLNVPTAQYPDAAVIQLRCDNVGRALAASPSSSGLVDSANIIVYEGLLYIDEDGDGLDADQEKQLGTSDYSIDSNGNGTNDYDECFNSSTSTNSPGGGGGSGDGGDDGEDDHDGHKTKIIYVDQAIGNDQFTGRSPSIIANKGPKKTVRAGLSIAETNDTIIIRSGNYNENLDIRGKDVKVFIEGNVRL